MIEKAYKLGEKVRGYKSALDTKKLARYGLIVDVFSVAMLLTLYGGVIYG